MPKIDQTEDFRLHIKFWKILGIWPKGTFKHYGYYMITFILTFCIFYDLLLTINFYFMPRQLDNYIEVLIFYFTEISVASKVLTFSLTYNKIEKIFKILEKEEFQPQTSEEYKVIDDAKRFNRRFYFITVTVSMISHLTHIFTPLILHVFLLVPLELPISSYSFIPEDMLDKFIYPLYFYQMIGMHSHVWYNLNIDSFFFSIMILTIAQLDILDGRLRKLTCDSKLEASENVINFGQDKERIYISKLNSSIKHFDEIGKFLLLIQQIFSVTLFVQFSMASAIICICVFRFTMVAPLSYYIFLSTYMFMMVAQILVPSWFGTQMIYKSTALSKAVYDCDWTVRSRQFKSNMRLFVERTARPLTIVGWKMFPLSLATFTSIVNTAYSFFTLLRYMQSRQ